MGTKQSKGATQHMSSTLERCQRANQAKRFRPARTTVLPSSGPKSTSPAARCMAGLSGGSERREATLAAAVGESQRCLIDSGIAVPKIAAASSSSSRSAFSAGVSAFGVVTLPDCTVIAAFRAGIGVEGAPTVVPRSGISLTAASLAPLVGETIQDSSARTIDGEMDREGLRPDCGCTIALPPEVGGEICGGGGASSEAMDDASRGDGPADAAAAARA